MEGFSDNITHLLLLIIHHLKKNNCDQEMKKFFRSRTIVIKKWHTRYKRNSITRSFKTRRIFC